MDVPGILSSSFRRTIKIDDNGEKLVDLRIECPEVGFEIADYLNQEDNPTESEDAHFVRESIADLINTAQSYLPLDLRLLIRCGYRTPEVQARQYKKDYDDLRLENPTWNKEKLDIEIVKRTDPPDVGSHCTGGAVDLSIIDENGNQLDMGTSMGTFNLKTYTLSNKISPAQIENRKILIDVMTKTGFLNFPAEWWHWSYGDREWAFANKRVPFYGPIEQRTEIWSGNVTTSDLFTTASGAF